MSQANVLRVLIRIVVETIHECGEMGCPGGPLYAAMMAHGVSFDQYNRFMNGLVEAKVIEQRGIMYYATKEGLTALGIQDNIPA